MTTTIAPAEAAAEQNVHEEVHPLVVLLARRPELDLAQAGVRILLGRLESA